MRKLIAFIVACLMATTIIDVNLTLFALDDEESSVETVLEENEEEAVYEGDSVENDSDLSQGEEVQQVENEIEEELLQSEEELEEETVEETGYEEAVEEVVQAEEITESSEEEAITEEAIIIEEVVEELSVVKEEAKDLVVTAEDNSVKGFVQRLYSLCLARAGEAGGINYWANLLSTNQMDAADVSEGFFYSNEFLNRRLNNEEFLNVVYKTFFDREPDANGYKYWNSVLSAGVSRKFVLKGFIESNEFTTLCDKYKIARGYLIVTRGYLENNISVARFVGRLYELCLGRTADTSGSTYWVKQLVDKTGTAADIVKGFFDSKEFKAKKVSNKVFIETAYRVMMDREAEESGLNYWLVSLNGGCSKDYVLSGFVSSNEFNNICKTYNVALGTIEYSALRDKEIGKTRLLGYAYYAATNKVTPTSKVNEIIKEVSKGKVLPSTMIFNLLNEYTFSNNKLTTAEKVRRASMAIGGKEPSSAFINKWVKDLDNGVSFTNLVEALTNSTEYKERCAAAKVDPTPFYATVTNVKETTITVNGKKIKVLVDGENNIIQNSLKANGYYYQIDSATGKIIHKQKLMKNDKVYMEGIDVSEAQGDIDLTEFQNGFVIIRAGYGWDIKQKDKWFDRNVKKCKELNIPFGVYWYSYAISKETSRKEAEIFAEVIEPYRNDITLGVWLDQEEVDYRKKKNCSTSAKNISALTDAFMDVLNTKGYYTGIYTSWSWAKNGYVDASKYNLWIAHWGKNDGTLNVDLEKMDKIHNTEIFKKTVLHQYSSKGITSGGKLIDLDVMYCDPQLLLY